MTPILTTITPYWGRPEMLKTWLKALNGAIDERVHHMVVVAVSEEDHRSMKLPDEWAEIVMHVPLHTSAWFVPRQPSICHYHNMGIKRVSTPWVMKLDVDAIPNVRFFSELLSVLEAAAPREWFNVGMIYLNRLASFGYFADRRLPVGEASYRSVMENLPEVCDGVYRFPAGSNFVCRREDYLTAMGGDDCPALSGFSGYGWEDYLQLYLLERHYLQKDPFAGWRIDIKNVTQLCRDNLSRVVAFELWKRNEWLSLLHHWHPVEQRTAYRDPARMDANRYFLLRQILKYRHQK